MFLTIKSKRNIFITAILFILATWLLSKLPVLLPWSIDVSFIGAFFIFIGVYLNKSKCFTSKTSIKEVFLIIISLIIYIWVIRYNSEINMSIREYGRHGFISVLAFCIVGVSGSIVCIYFSKLINTTRLGKTLSYVGKNTVVLLSLHLFIFFIIDKYITSMYFIELQNGVGKYLYGYLRIIVTIIVCIGTSFSSRIIIKFIKAAVAKCNGILNL